MNEESIKDYVEYVGTSNGLFICVKDMFKDFFHVKKNTKRTSTNEKHQKLFRYLKEFQSGSNEEITNLLGHKHASQTSLFLKKSNYVKKGKTYNSKWSLK